MGETLAGFSPDVSSLLHDLSTYTDLLPKEISSKIESISKFEYVLGAKEIQANYVLYAPKALYESAEFETHAIVATATMEVDEFHPLVQSTNGSRPRSSTEWELEFSPDRKVPIYPVNHVSEGLLPVVNEFLDIDPSNRIGLSRFPSHLNYAVIRENEEILVAGIDYNITWTIEFGGRLQIDIYEHAFDLNAVYTIDYFALPSSVEVDVLTTYHARRIPSPDTFSEGTDSNDKVTTTYYPFVNYGIVNSTAFSIDDETNEFIYTEPTGAYTVGKIHVQPTWIATSGEIIPDYLISGNNIIYLVDGGLLGSGNFSILDVTYSVDPYRYYLTLENYSIPFEVTSIDGDQQLSIAQVPLLRTGVIGDSIDATGFFGNMLTDIWPMYTGVLTGYLEIPYSLQVIYKDGDELFGFDNLSYEPITCHVGGTKAKNITDYVNLEQPAFTVSESQDDELEFIHDGKFIYFNQGIPDTEILVDYKKLTDYIKVNCTLRSNKIVNPSVSPQINEYRLLLNTTIL